MVPFRCRVRVHEHDFIEVVYVGTTWILFRRKSSISLKTTSHSTMNINYTSDVKMLSSLTEYKLCMKTKWCPLVRELPSTSRTVNRIITTDSYVNTYIPEDSILVKTYPLFIWYFVFPAFRGFLDCVQSLVVVSSGCVVCEVDIQYNVVFCEHIV
jgi:hypothetical protein